MAHLAFDYQPDHDFIAAQIEADLAAETTDAVVIPGPWSVHPHTDTADTR
ncbi:hypothetical protein HQ305_19860 [Rhodococcus sp. BP-149]|nr:MULTISPECIES: hypothetical protein [unclassified Rhodococcus (in: high G+C Gram-positive bacteria)]MBY6687492.1 hypothetical protein [Rhodococcus sp. BP-288]MBY6696413.1 hypothetical protein [Rhodococcus sp. BP-188]MBY6700545.1 hypothetical protein [Rhodococcus sp. BP-285]MBY6704432.1 hypothetical protein [Rhodococcus sp. BP-283]MBY6713670.1 hypothetical protein [Rhodococcus sp. BP-160]